MISPALSRILSFAILALASPLYAVTYDLADFPFTYEGASSVTGTLTTSTLGTFTTEKTIEDFFENGDYSLQLLNGQDVLSQFEDNDPTFWDLQLTNGATASVTSTVTEVTLSFSTPNETSEATLILQNAPNGVFQFHQSNNVTDRNFVDFDHNAISTANAELSFGSDFVLPAVPEPATSLPFAIGALLLLTCSRRT